MKILVINGPNINMLGIREKHLYGNNTYDDLVNMIKKWGSDNRVDVDCYQSNSEGDIVTTIQNSYNKIDGIVINAAAYTHTSVAILDALKAVNIRTVEVHLTDIYTRDEFRKHSYVSLYAEKVIVGKGFDGYIEALDYLKNSSLA